MTVVVSFIKPQSDEAVSGISECRVREDIAPPGVTANSAMREEVVIIGNSETSMVAVAFGSVPDAAAMVATAQTSAGIPVPAGCLSYAIYPQVGDKISVKVVP